MERFVFIVTNNEDHWRDIAENLIRGKISFFPYTKDEFERLRSLCFRAFSQNDKVIEDAKKEIKKIFDDTKKEFSCIIRFKITDGGSTNDGVLFFRFYEEFLKNHLNFKKILVYIDYGKFSKDCSCSDCYNKRSKQEEDVINYCVKYKIPFFTEDAEEMSFSIDLLF